MAVPHILLYEGVGDGGGMEHNLALQSLGKATQSFEPAVEAWLIFCP